jgi:hypothetical protein
MVIPLDELEANRIIVLAPALRVIVIIVIEDLHFEVFP